MDLLDKILQFFGLRRLPPSTNAPIRDDVDVDAILEYRASEKGQDLNWRQSIIDLLKLIDVDSDAKNRAELAVVLNIDPAIIAKPGSAELNEALRVAVMRELVRSGGKVSSKLQNA